MATSIVGRIVHKSSSKAFYSTLAFRTSIVSLGITHVNYIKSIPPKPLVQNIRFKYDKKGKTQQYDSDSDEEEEFTSDRDSKIVKTKLNSLRADLVLKSGLNLARNKIETHFYESKIRVNGQKLLKKSAQLEIGDEIDIVKGPSPLNKDHLLISRVEILSATPKDEDLAVVLRRYKTMTIENYKDAWSPSE
ncbi:uncharacterized protein C6orf203 homolog [Ctenocephalides felis]|uniref:uncharacterized protein C6orf203 homolog n=1 Tax=Ctenocephalides felis TaxID=7515 RepID=UPI000E6E3D99|nr:uncharacterized protein C6orf203 homolog [Ctenocephalides felis]